MRSNSIKIAFTLLLLSASVALAHTGASGIVKKRMEMMGDIAAQMKTVAQMLNGKDVFDPQQITNSARRIADHAKSFEELFPKGTNKSPSEARPAIWIKWDEFLEHSNSMKTSAVALATAAKTAEGPLDIKKPFGQLGMSCKGCHQDFRQKK